MEAFNRFCDRFVSAFYAYYNLEDYKNDYIKRLLSQKKADNTSTKLYSKEYYNYRKKYFNYTNKNHNYYLTGKFQNTLSIVYEKGVLYLKTDADYYKYLLSKFSDAVSPFGVEKYNLIKRIKRNAFSDG
ncbi:MAG: hypothetical protein NZZ41_06865 [Candidatus Dojkabacteria bacterium]|nr:hypothetical protein [Candidatus Dojkabacteria bacterium]